MSFLKRLTPLTALTALALALVPAAPTSAAPRSASPSGGTIHPGVQVFTDGAQCTANFVFFDASNVYIGQAAHCSGTEGVTSTDGCTSESLPLGTPVMVTGASRPGVMVYNSWLTMQAVNEANTNACQYNDLALVRLDPSDAARVNPSVPHWGGPTGLNTVGTAPGESVYSYGSSELRLGFNLLSPKKGVSEGDSGGGWNHDVITLTPGIPGDSGSAFLDAQGRALGTLSTLGIGLPGGVVNGVGDLRRELAYMRAHTPLTGVQLAPGTVAFNGNKLPLGLL